MRSMGIVSKQLLNSSKLVVSSTCNYGRGRGYCKPPKYEPISMSYNSYETTSTDSTAAPVIIMHGK